MAPSGPALIAWGSHLLDLLKRYIWNLLVALDQLLNTLLGGDPDETISSRAAKSPHLPHWLLLIWILETFDTGHMRRSIEEDEGQDSIFNRKNKRQ